MRPSKADLAPASAAAGRANAWTLGPDGKVVGLADYLGGLPALFGRGVEGFEARNVRIERPSPLPAGWNASEMLL